MNLHPVLGTDLPPLTAPVPVERRDWYFGAHRSRRQPLVRLVLRLRGTTCHLCGGENATTADHLIPWSHGGRNTLDNLAPAHQACNSARRDTPLRQWFANRPVRTPALTPSRRW